MRASVLDGVRVGIEGSIGFAKPTKIGNDDIVASSSQGLDLVAPAVPELENNQKTIPTQSWTHIGPAVAQNERRVARISFRHII